MSNTSLNATSYSWNFGGALVSTSTETNPSVNFLTDGTYVVTLTATGAGGVNTVTKTVTVSVGLPIADFTFTPSSGRAPITVGFTNTSQNATSYSWNFGTSGLTSTLANPSINFTIGGTYAITLTATNANGSKTVTKNITIQPPYTKVRIKNVRITALPFTRPNGGSWDSNDGPDVYYKILGPNPTNPTLLTSGFFPDVVLANLPLNYPILSPFFLVPTLNETYYVNLYDRNTIATDSDMGYIGFQMDNYMTGANAFPTQITRTLGSITAILDLQWEE